MSTITRNGKIARLPKRIRDRLNQQILDGVPGKDLVRWLNRNDDVREVLLHHFNAREITEQNLSEWKQGGYQDWLKHQETCDWVRRISDEAEDVVEESGALPWMERVGAHFELLLGKVVEAKSRQPVESPEQMAELINLSRELARHRQLSQEAAKQRRKEMRRRERENPGDMEERIDRAHHKALLHYLKLINRQTFFNHATNGMTPEMKARFEKMVEEKALEYLDETDSPGFAESPDGNRSPDDENGIGVKMAWPSSPTESDSIRPDPTSSSAEA